MAQTGLDRSYAAVVDAAGAATVTITPDGLQQWRVTQISVELDDNTAAAGVIRKNGRMVAPFVPQADAISGDPPLFLRPGDRVTVEWSGCLPGGQASALVFYDEVDW